LTVRPEEATYWDRKEKRKRTASIWALSLEVEGEDMQKLIANLTENARLFAETRKLLGTGGKVFEVVEDEQEQATELPAEFYPTSANGSVTTEGAAVGSPSDTPLAATAPQPTPKPSPSENNTAPRGGNGSGKPPVEGAAAMVGIDLPLHPPRGLPRLLRTITAMDQRQVPRSTNCVTSS
jgi:hypothetical protein